MLSVPCSRRFFLTFLRTRELRKSRKAEKRRVAKRRLRAHVLSFARRRKFKKHESLGPGYTVSHFNETRSFILSFMFETRFETFVTVWSPSGCSMNCSVWNWEIKIERKSFQKVPGQTVTALHAFFMPEIVTCSWVITLYSPRKTELVKFFWTILDMKAELSSLDFAACAFLYMLYTLWSVYDFIVVNYCSVSNIVFLKMCFGKTNILSVF